ncbi:MAG TPA: hypothetical protein DET40_13590 [Lentisphaeria bacterium]|nr:MAG: hypothetical protein A2X45_01605 [Lentisphaerae bacterium GWF2_50_93]HCE44573.1 hypothetical protein [Lentisphaeria bacterium]
MNTELDKIRHYFGEGRKLGLNSPADWHEQDLYARWELEHRPMPFILKDRDFILAGKKFVLPAGKGSPMCGFFTWDNEAVCASLILETSDSEYSYLLKFRNGEPRIEPGSVKSTDRDESACHGDQLEAVYDLIGHLKDTGNSTGILELSRKEFLSALESVSGHHNPDTIVKMKKLALKDIRDLLREASSDMAEDELGNQLSLGLGGSYAAGNLRQEKTESKPASVPARTRWTITRELQFLERACLLSAETEKTFALTFNGAEIVGTLSGIDLPLRMPVPISARLVQGDILKVFLRGERKPVATFKIDILDGDMLYGRLRSDFSREAQEYFPRMYGLPPKSPSEFIAASIGILYSAIRESEDYRLSPALRYCLGMVPFISKSCVPDNPPPSLDQSQLRAFGAATDPENPVILVQGPPGTGKSYALEQVLRHLCSKGLRVLAAAPSNTAIDNICRRLSDMPVLRFGSNPSSIAPDIAGRNWVGNHDAVDRFVAGRKKTGGGIYAGTNVSLLRDQIVIDDMKLNGLYDAVVFDEAGMSNLPEFLLCANMGKRAVLFGDHRQLPPFPMPESVYEKLETEFKAVPHHLRNMVSDSALEYLALRRGIPVIMLEHSYRCQNPRLLRFSSTLFYGAGVKTSCGAEYYRLPYHERESRYPASSMRIYSTSSLPESIRNEQLFVDAGRPGLANRTEALICADIFYRAAAKYPLEEISIIAPYRRQVSLIREILSPERIGQAITPEHWNNFLRTRIATVDSFQGGESDVVIICYVRSGRSGIGFIDNPNRINVAHTRCRREMHIVGDIEYLKTQSRSRIFERLERAFMRDGEVVQVTEGMMMHESRG